MTRAYMCQYCEEIIFDAFVDGVKYPCEKSFFMGKPNFQKHSCVFNNNPKEEKERQ